MPNFVAINDSDLILYSYYEVLNHCQQHMPNHNDMKDCGPLLYLYVVIKPMDVGDTSQEGPSGVEAHFKLGEQLQDLDG
ncbi:hypothetical protein U1Q18_008731 [Sarracenia purpurea var. burkii]